MWRGFVGFPIPCWLDLGYYSVVNTSTAAFYGLIVLAVAFEVVSDTLFKHWSNTDRALRTVLGVAMCVASIVFCVFTFKRESFFKVIRAT